MSKYFSYDAIEEDGKEAAEEFKYIVQPPVIVECEQNNGWIKREDISQNTKASRLRIFMMVNLKYKLPAILMFCTGNNSRRHQQNNQRPPKCGLFFTNFAHVTYRITRLK